MFSTGVKRDSGAVLVFVLVCVITLAVVVSALLMLSANRAMGNLVTVASLSRSRIVRSAKGIVGQCLLDAAQNNGDFSNVGTKSSAATARLGDGIWTSSLSGVTVPSFTLGDRAASFGPTDGAPLQVSGLVARARLTPITAMVTTTGSPNGSTAITSSSSITVEMVEIPTTEFAFVVSDAAFQQSAQTNVTISGYALFNAGVSPQSPVGLKFDGLSTSVGIYFGSTGIPSPTDGNYMSMPLGSPTGFTRGIGGMSNLIVDPTASVSAMVDRQALSRPPSDYVRLSWTDPTAAASGLVPGITMQTIMGVNRIAVDLATYSGYQNIWIDCTTAATKANGIVVLGSPAGGPYNATPLSIVTDGQLTLLGPNARCVITATNYGLSIGADRTTPTNTPSANIAWTGYVCLAVSSPTITSPNSWGSYAFNIQGTFAFPGGTLNNSAVPLVVSGSRTTALALASGDILADRLFFSEVR